MSEQFKEIVAWLGIFGIPSIFTMTMWCVKRCVGYSKRLSVLIKSQQAQMRSQLLKDYHIYMDKYEREGYIYDSQQEDFNNQYQSYHILGANGVMDSKYEKIMSLPTKPDPV